MKLSMCIAGCGGYARTVLRDIHELTDEFDLYFASRSIEKARQYSEEYGGVGYFGSYEEAVASPDVDSVYFFTPHDLHLPNSLLAASHSKHVLVEKPIARTIDESMKLVDGVQDAGVNLMIAENYRFLPTVQKAKELIENGDLGSLRLIQIQAEGFSVPTKWRTDSAANGGGVFIDGGIHFVDVVLYLGGFPERVYAAQPPQVFNDVAGEDGLVVMLHLEGGALGLINFSRATPVPDSYQHVSVTGSKGRVSFVPYGNELYIETLTSHDTIQLPDAFRGVRGMVREFRSSIHENRKPTMSGEEGVKDLAVVLAAYQSAAENRVIELSGSGW
ncbi:MAG: Gfo/Idh/MocA family oxidoreductase [Chloroflexi bacterium]|nr:Gfo/Idh/MocA family oxidoreductase [Chloroflexota bacterium]